MGFESRFRGDLLCDIGMVFLHLESDIPDIILTVDRMLHALWERLIPELHQIPYLIGDIAQGYIPFVYISPGGKRFCNDLRINTRIFLFGQPRPLVSCG